MDGKLGLASGEIWKEVAGVPGDLHVGWEKWVDGATVGVVAWV